ncbi:hypothetical protein [Myroides sp. DW712]|uniref:hypothetical protein n=1 Tax=Myroides sp. DW712 TaxID=3389800 RepID=UPI00397A34CE
MKVKIHCKIAILLLLVLFALVSCKDDFKVYPIGLDAIDLGNLEEELYIKEIDFRYLERGNTNFNEIVFTLNPLNAMRNSNPNFELDESLKVDIWLTYKNKKYKIFQQFLSIHDMYKGEFFTVECGTESMDTSSELYSFFQKFDSYNTRERVEILKQELPKFKLYISFRNEIMELTVTNKTNAVYTKVPNHMRNIISISYD